MSDEKEIKNLDNLTKIDFKKKQTAFRDEFISRSEVHSILSSNFIGFKNLAVKPLTRKIQPWLFFRLLWLNPNNL